jgi:hypothetical protein
MDNLKYAQLGDNPAKCYAHELTGRCLSERLVWRVLY